MGVSAVNRRRGKSAVSERVTGIEPLFREYLATGGGTDRCSLAAFLQGTLEGCSTDEHRVLMLLNDPGVLEQMLKLPQDFAFEKALPVWLEDVRRSGHRGDTVSVSGALRIAGKATGADVRGLLLEHVARQGGVDGTEELRRGLSIACPGREFLVGALFRAVDSGVLAELQHCSDPAQLPALRDSAVNRLRDSSLSEDLPTWIVDSWLLALGHPVSETATVPAASWVSRAFRCAGVILVSVLLCRQLFWCLWGVDEESRWRSGFENLWVCVISGFVIASVLGFFVMRVLSVYRVTRCLFERRPPWFGQRITFWSGAAGGFVGGLLVAGESMMTEERIYRTGILCGLLLGTLLLRLFWDRAFRYACYGYALVLLTLNGHVWLYYDEDPKHPWLTSHMPGGDAFFFVFCVAAGSAVPGIWMYSNYRAWKRRPEHRFLTLREHSVSSDPLLAASSGGSVIVWWGDGKTGIQTTDGSGAGWRQHTCRLTALAFSQCGKLFASAGNDARIFVWRTQQSDPVVTLGKHWKGVTCLAWSHCGTRLATGGADEQVLVWDTVTWQPVNQLRGLNAPVYSLAFEDQDRSLLFVGLQTGEVCRVSLSDNCVTHRQNLSAGHRPRIAVAAGTGLLTAGGQDAVVTCLTSNLQVLARANYEVVEQAEPVNVRSLEYVREAKRALMLCGTTVHTWDLTSVSTSILSRTDHPQAICGGGHPFQFTAIFAGRKIQALTLSGQESPVGGEGRQRNIEERIRSLLDRLQTWLLQHFEPWGLQGLLLKISLLTLCSVGGYHLFGFAGIIPGGSLELLWYALHCSEASPFNVAAANEAFRFGKETGWAVLCLQGGLTAAIACFMSITNRWSMELIRVSGESGVLWAYRWLSLPALIVAYLTSGFFEGPIERFVFDSLFWLICLGLTGWSAGVWWGVLKTVLMIVFRVGSAGELTTRLFLAGRSQFGMLYLLLLAICGVAVGGGRLLMLLPSPDAPFVWLLGATDTTGTSSGRGLYPKLLSGTGTPGEPVSTKDIWLDFQTDYEGAEQEYVGREFLIEGIMTRRFPEFRLVSEPGGLEKVHCDFDYQDFPLIMDNRLLNGMPAGEGLKEVQLREGQRVLVGGTCRGLSAEGLVVFQGCRINRSMFRRELWPKGFSVDP